eukprot:scaffold131935_cov36-Phaeocystis_antarctica.AAC.1
MGGAPAVSKHGTWVHHQRHLLRRGLIILTTHYSLLTTPDSPAPWWGVEAADDAAEDSVLTIEVRCTLEGDNVSRSATKSYYYYYYSTHLEGDEELAAVGVGPRVSHREYAASLVPQLIRALIIEWLLPHTLASRARAGGVTSLSALECFIVSSGPGR